MNLTNAFAWSGLVTTGAGFYNGSSLTVLFGLSVIGGAYLRHRCRLRQNNLQSLRKEAEDLHQTVERMIDQ